MALELAPITTSSVTTQKQITIPCPSVLGVFYTVPTNKTFTGYVYIYANGYVQINGNTVLQNSGSVLNITLPLTLPAGSTIGNGSSSYYQWTLIGIEQ